MTLGIVFLAIVAIAFLVWMRRNQSQSRALQRSADLRRDSAQVMSRGEFIDGNRRLAVALALTDAALYYENADMQGSLERQWIHEIEYDNELTTGQSIGDGTVLRLRCFSQKFEFLLAPAIVSKWKAALPPHALQGAR